ncbi:MAG: aromatic ring-hydroxylating dioxygenase subunit alpha [Pseudomonadota bacterium]
MLEQTEFIRNAWYVAAWDHELQAGTPLARTLLGERVVLYRDAAGRPVALEDRCCHRAAPLSLGRVEGDCIRCMYHGLKFDANGRCVEIPAQAHVPPQAAVRAFTVCEQDHFVWIWMGERELAGDSRPPAIPWQSDAGWCWKPGYMHYRANIQLITDNLLDLSHLSFVHLATLGTPQTAQTQPAYREIEGGVEVSRWDIDSAPTPLHAKAGMQGKVDRWLVFRWYPPGTFLLDAGSCPTGTGAPQGVRQGGIQFRNTSIQTPETAHTTHYFWTHARDFRLDDEALTDEIQAQVAAAFEEDRVVIEAQQEVLRTRAPGPIVGIVADAGPRMARRLIELRLAQDSAAEFA